ncbi:MAG TPA: hypothetical protein VKT28_07910 [Puia sp.]|nr:hypothetical protein [Puia sp.]
MIAPFKKIWLVSLIMIVFASFMNQACAQALSASQKKDLVNREDSLKGFAHNIVFAIETEDRFRSDSQFVKMLVRALKVKNSFYYPFDSLQSISRLYAPDSAFRIFTWQLKKDEYTYFQRGAIQMHTADGSLKLIPLHDVSNFSKKLDDSIRTPNNWIGAIYYRIVMKTSNSGKKIYTLLGFDDYTLTSTRKWMEILTFDNEGNPVFGGPYISFREDSVHKPTRLRFNIEYKKEASTTFNYNPEMDMIVFDDLISESDQPALKDTYIPDGDFQGFKWQNGQWVHVEKIFNFRLKDGDYPKDNLLRDENGNLDEQKLIQQSQKNQIKKDSTRKKPVKKDGN